MLIFEKALIHDWGGTNYKTANEPDNTLTVYYKNGDNLINKSAQIINGNYNNLDFSEESPRITTDPVKQYFVKTLQNEFVGAYGGFRHANQDVSQIKLPINFTVGKVPPNIISIGQTDTTITYEIADRTVVMYDWFRFVFVNVETGISDYEPIVSDLQGEIDKPVEFSGEYSVFVIGYKNETQEHSKPTEPFTYLFTQRSDIPPVPAPEKTEVIDNLNSTLTKSALSANMGRVLHEQINNLDFATHEEVEIAAGNAESNAIAHTDLRLTDYLTEEEVNNLLIEHLESVLRDKGALPSRSDLPPAATNFDSYLIEDEELIVFAYNTDTELVWLPLNFFVDMSLYETVVGATEKMNAAITAAKAYADSINIATNNNLNNHKNNTSNPHSVTASQVGLGNVNNTSDINKPVSNATLTALNEKVDIKGTQLGANANDQTFRLCTLDNASLTGNNSASLVLEYYFRANITRTIEIRVAQHAFSEFFIHAPDAPPTTTFYRKVILGGTQPATTPTKIEIGVVSSGYSYTKVKVVSFHVGEGGWTYTAHNNDSRLTTYSDGTAINTGTQITPTIRLAPMNTTLADEAASTTLPTTASGTLVSKIQALRNNVKALFGYFTNGVANTAAVLSNTRTFNISGAATGTAQNFNGSQNVTIPVTISAPDNGAYHARAGNEWRRVAAPLEVTANNWVSRSVNHDFRNFVYAQNKIWLPNGSGQMRTTTDGITLTNNGPSNIISLATNGSTHFIGCINNSTQYAFSTNGASSWANGIPGGSGNWLVVKFAAGVFIIAGQGGRIGTITNWELTTRSSGRSTDITSLAYSSKLRRWAGTTSSQYIIYSDDNGATWASYQGVQGSSTNSMAHGNDVFVAIGTMSNGTAPWIIFSENGTSWSSVDFPGQGSTTSPKLVKVGFGNGKFLITRTDGSTLTSVNGRFWQVGDNINGSMVMSSELDYVDGMWWCGNNGNLATSA